MTRETKSRILGGEYPRVETPLMPARKSNAPLIVALAAGGGLLVLLIVGGCVAGSYVTDKKPAAYTREEFRAAAIGKNADQVIATFGRPNGTYDRSDGRPETWYYYGRVRNPHTGKLEKGVLEFQNGVVAEVRW